MQVPAPYVHNELGPGRGGGGPKSRVFNMGGGGWGGGAVTTSGLGKLNGLAFFTCVQTHWVLGSAALPSFFTPVLVEA